MNIALLANDHDQIDFEIYSPAGDEEIVHCQGHAVWNGQTASSNLDLAQLRASGETLARLQLPNSAENTLREYVLHPYLLEEALQAAFGSLDGGSERSRAAASAVSTRLFARHVRLPPGNVCLGALREGRGDREQSRQAGYRSV